MRCGPTCPDPESEVCFTVTDLAPPNPQPMQRYSMAERKLSSPAAGDAACIGTVSKNQHTSRGVAQARALLRMRAGGADGPGNSCDTHLETERP